MRIVRASSYRRMPWKNGGGETAEIFVSPAEADFGSMDWRLSMATVARDGPFSSFPGVDRTLTVLTGTLGLDIGRARVDLMEMSPPYSFPGETAAHGIVVRGPVVDLNVMTRRRAFRHAIRRTSIVGEKTIVERPSTLLLFCHTGAIAIAGGETLYPLDAALIAPDEPPLVVSSQTPSTLYVIAIERI